MAVPHNARHQCRDAKHILRDGIDNNNGRFTRPKTKPLLALSGKTMQISHNEMILHGYSVITDATSVVMMQYFEMERLVT